MTGLHRARRDVRSTSRIQRGLEERRGWWDRILELPTVWAAVAIVGSTWLLMPHSTNVPVWQPGDVATFDVVVPRDLTVPDEVATEAMRDEARAAVLPVYDLEPRLRYDLEERIRGMFGACRALPEDAPEPTAALVEEVDLRVPADTLAMVHAAECPEEVETAMVDVVTRLYQARVVDDATALERRAENGLVLRNLASDTEHNAPLAAFAGAVDARGDLTSEIRSRVLEHDDVTRRWIKPATDLIEANIIPNLLFNRAETADRARRAAEQIAPVSQVLRRGQVLVRRGDRVTPSVARTLRELAGQRREMADAVTVLGIGLLMTVMVLGWRLILGRFGETDQRRTRLSIVFLLMLLFVALGRFVVLLASGLASNTQGLAVTVDALLWVVPHAAGPAAVLLLLGMPAAVLFAVFGAVASAIMLGGDFTTMVYALAGGLAGALAAHHFRDRTASARMGAVIGIANVAVMLVLELYRGLPELPESVAIGAACAFLGGPLAVGVVSFLLPLLEALFGITTDIRLLELSNQNLPLLKRLSLEAPGTYQHSLAVGNLAEAGADAIGANALLLRVCAYYHDVGKLVKPEYFVENQRGRNPHDTLSPSMSALVIMSHVKEGLELARKASLPLPIRHSIATHHGTKLITYFYNRAKERSIRGGGDVVESNYRYPGPRPHSKEEGVLLLADAVEAAARTVDQPTPNRIQAMINRIFTDVLEDGQLDDCELTIAELDKIASAFLWVLTNMYHHRIDYPGFDFNRRKERRESGPDQVGPKTVAASG